ncbi:MAG: hypothetical protein H0T89_11445 [Deltaproteobacteria bacterium]|nr:hypothetical protein [Deltaproteobacteria bacterium]MDQ3295817.1 hypothetical protein [Myxococcota bacterium]
MTSELPTVIVWSSSTRYASANRRGSKPRRTFRKVTSAPPAYAVTFSPGTESPPTNTPNLGPALGVGC